MDSGPILRLGTRRARLAMLALVTASGVAFLDSSVVTVALPRIGADLGGGLATVQWVLDSYLLTLGAFLLVGGALGDLLGKRRVFTAGLVGFAAASALCGLAPTAPALVAARGLQGVAAALLVPGSLSIITAAFGPADRPRAIGLWSGLAGLFTLLGPFVGGLLVDAAPSGWRWVFGLNLPLVAGALVLTRRYVPTLPGTRDDGSLWGQVDVVGGILAVAGLGLVAGALIETSALGPPRSAGLVLTGLVLLGGLGRWEARVEDRAGAGARRSPMLPMSLFAVRTFTLANLVTLLVYGPLGAVFFLVTVQLMVTLGWSALAAGASGVPITLALAALSGRVGSLVPRCGVRPPLVVGPVVMSLGLLLLSGVSAGDAYLTGVLPGILVLAAGLVLVVAPVTAAALGDVGTARAGAASGVNNAVARVATLLAVAGLPVAAGIGSGALTPASMADGYPRALWLSAGVCLAAGAVALALPRDAGRVDPRDSAEVGGPAPARE